MSAEGVYFTISESSKILFSSFNKFTELKDTFVDVASIRCNEMRRQIIKLALEEMDLIWFQLTDSDSGIAIQWPGIASLLDPAHEVDLASCHDLVNLSLDMIRECITFFSSFTQHFMPDLAASIKQQTNLFDEIARSGLPLTPSAHRGSNILEMQLFLVSDSKFFNFTHYQAVRTYIRWVTTKDPFLYEGGKIFHISLRYRARL